MNGSVPPTLIEEAAVAVEGFEEIEIGFRAQPVEISDLEVGPLERMLC